MQAVAEVDDPLDGVSVTFTDPGPLGLKFTPNKHTGKTEVLAVNAGTQAERHLQLCPGLVLMMVGDRPVDKLGYRETLAVLKSSTRPVTLTFVHGGSMHTQNSSHGRTGA